MEICIEWTVKKEGGPPLDIITLLNLLDTRLGNPSINLSRCTHMEICIKWTVKKEGGPPLDIITLLNLLDTRLGNPSINFRWSFGSIKAIFPAEHFGHTLPPDGVVA